LQPGKHFNCNSSSTSDATSSNFYNFYHTNCNSNNAPVAAWLALSIATQALQLQLWTCNFYQMNYNSNNTPIATRQTLQNATLQKALRLQLNKHSGCNSANA
jgi:hypothetical protein